MIELTSSVDQSALWKVTLSREMIELHLRALKTFAQLTLGVSRNSTGHPRKAISRMVDVGDKGEVEYVEACGSGRSKKSMRKAQYICRSVEKMKSTCRSNGHARSTR